MSAVKRRDSLKKSLRRVANSFDNDISAGEANVILQSLENYFAKFLAAQLEVDDVTGDAEAGFQEIEMIDGEKLYLEAKLKLLGIIAAAQPPPPLPIQT